MDGDAQLFPRLPALRRPQPWDRLEDPASPAPASDKGFDNPVFNVVSQPCQGHRDARGCGQELLGLQPGHSREPVGVTLTGILLSPGQEGSVGHSHAPSGHQPLDCCRDSALGGLCQALCFSSPSVVFPLLLLQEPPGADLGEETPKDLQVFYLNPLYDASETET